MVFSVQFFGILGDYFYENHLIEIDFDDDGSDTRPRTSGDSNPYAQYVEREHYEYNTKLYGATYLSWEIEDWGPSILPLVPEEGSFDVLKHAARSRKATIQRRGVGVPATIDALNTQQGMARLASQFSKIMASTHWTMALMVVQAIRSAHDGPMFRFHTMGNSLNVQRQIEFDAGF